MRWPSTNSVKPCGMPRTPKTLAQLSGLLGLALSLHGCSAPAAVPRIETASTQEPLSAYGNPPTYVALGVRYYVMDSADGYVERGLASWYGPNFHGQKTSSGEPFDMHQVTAAHKTLPLPTWVKVTHLKTGRSITVRVNDRGPFKEGRIIDLSYQAAQALGIVEEGLAPVEVRAIRGPDTKSRRLEHTYLQLAAFSQSGNAKDYIQELRSRGLTRLSIQTRRRDPVLHRVMHGPFRNREELKQAIAALETVGITEYTAVSTPAP